MSCFEVGDVVKILDNVLPAERVYVGKEGTIDAIDRYSNGNILEVIFADRERAEFYEHEVEKIEAIDEFTQLQRKISQAIADKAEQMRGCDGRSSATIESDEDFKKIWHDNKDVGKEVIYDAYNNDVVQAPSHYVNSKIEPIAYMADKLPAYDDGHTAFCVGNVIKYVSRAPHKGTLIQDLEKAAKYLEFAIEHEKGKQ